MMRVLGNKKRKKNTRPKILNIREILEIKS